MVAQSALASAPAARMQAPVRTSKDADRHARVTTPGALVVTPSGRVARVVRVVDAGRVEVEYLEATHCILDPLFDVMFAGQ